MHPTILEHISYDRGQHIKSMREADNIHKVLDHISTQINELIYMVGDSPTPPTEDQLLNYLIGMYESVQVKKQIVNNEEQPS